MLLLVLKGIETGGDGSLRQEAGTNCTCAAHRDTRIKCIRTDNGTEYVNKQLQGSLRHPSSMMEQAGTAIVWTPTLSSLRGS
ncbi:hypothetical protein PsorP6_001945 [Peronosclerospora sorghi]|uniref:Uncharacterized protein n=1 Tax=Peronosclerospora sorghi TaxID=230839 RepID=A0ACC0WTU6_9STRA|nr:hypothetical protein PsorP6_001945 [Peronosclerospora sorghi]